MRKFCITLLLPLFCFSAIGQTAKTYTGPYHKGQATYSYIEKEDGSRVYEGAFTWKERVEMRDLTAKGNFVNGKRDGLWVFTATNISKSKIPTTETLKVFYKDGVHAGEYSYKAAANYSGKDAKGSFIKNDYGSAPEGMVLTATCKDNRFDGVLKMSGTSGLKWETTYDASGSQYKTGIWKYTNEVGTYYWDKNNNEQYLINKETGDKESRNSSGWSVYQGSIKARCIDLEAFCEPYPKTSGRYVPITEY